MKYHCFSGEEHNMEEVLKKAEAEAEDLEKKAVQLGKEAAKKR
ncbi:hypothetical protein HMPREF1148_0982 [Selenomonas sp. FOBRC6]|nr:hypothetical protein HMPREF1148_0982 [Selenomonas sp. FOBRC6]